MALPLKTHHRYDGNNTEQITTILDNFSRFHRLSGKCRFVYFACDVTCQVRFLTASPSTQTERLSWSPLRYCAPVLALQAAAMFALPLAPELCEYINRISTKQ